MRHAGGEKGDMTYAVRKMFKKDRARNMSFYGFQFAAIYKNIENPDIIFHNGQKVW